MSDQQGDPIAHLLNEDVVDVYLARDAEWLAKLEPHQIGQLHIDELVNGGYAMTLILRPTRTLAQAKEDVRAARVRLDQLFETRDPDRNGWYPSVVPGRWYMTLAEVELDDLG